MKRLKDSRIGIPQRVVAFFMVWTMLLTMMPILATGADDVDLRGMGIYNHVMSDQTDLQTVYQLTFYRTVETVTPSETEGQPPVITHSYETVTLPDEYPLKDNNGNLLYLDSSGELMMEKNQLVNFLSSSNSSFKNFLLSRKITRIVIDVQCDEFRNGQNVKIYEQYESQAGAGFSGNSAPYDGDPTTTNDPSAVETPLSREIYKPQYNEEGTGIVDQSNYTIRQYDLTPWWIMMSMCSGVIPTTVTDRETLPFCSM